MKKLLPSVIFIGFFCTLCSGCFKDPNDKETENGSGSGGSSSGSANITSSLLAYYTFNNQDANDLTENQVHASIHNQARYESVGSHNGTYYLLLSGVKEANMCIPQNLFKGRDRWTVSFWIKDLSAGKIFAAQESVTGGGWHDSPVFIARQSGDLGFSHNYGCWSYGFETMNYNYIDASTEWHHWVLTVSPADDTYSSVSNAKLYIDGVLRSNINSNYSSSAVSMCTQIFFGGDGDGACASMKIDDIRIYGRTLGQKDVTALYNAEK